MVVAGGTASMLTLVLHTEAVLSYFSLSVVAGRHGVNVADVMSTTVFSPQVLCFVLLDLLLLQLYLHASSPGWHTFH